MEKDEAAVFAYADDTMIILSGNSVEVMKGKIKTAIQNASYEMNKLNLTLNMSKTEILTLGTIIQQDFPKIGIEVNGFPKNSIKTIKYLGIMIDWKLEWCAHLDYLEKKTEKLLPKIISISQNTFGYSTEARKIMLHSTIVAYYKYASTSYSQALMIERNQKKLNNIQKRMNVCIGRLYCTVSFLGSCIITG